MGKKDPALTYLAQFGYSVVRLPRQDIAPLQLFSRDGRDLSPIGDLTQLFTPGTSPVPAIRRDQKAADVTGTIKTTLSLGLGLSVLGNFLKAFGVDAALDASYQKARTVSFEFKTLLSDLVDTLAVEQCLNAAHVTPGAPHVSQLLDADQIYLITRTLKSKSFTVDASGEGGAKLDLNLPAIQQAVGAKLNVSRDGTSTSKVTYEGDTLLVFGVQAIRLFYDQGQYKSYEDVGPGSVTARAFKKPGKKKAAPKRAARKRVEFLSDDRAFFTVQR